MRLQDVVICESQLKEHRHADEGKIDDIKRSSTRDHKYILAAQFFS